MKEKKKHVHKEAANVEFGVEFGDLNTSKMYERPFPQKNNRKKQK